MTTMKDDFGTWVQINTLPGHLPPETVREWCNLVQSSSCQPIKGSFHFHHYIVWAQNDIPRAVYHANNHRWSIDLAAAGDNRILTPY